MVTVLGTASYDIQEQAPDPQSIVVPDGTTLCVFFWTYWTPNLGDQGGTLDFVTLDGAPFTEATSIPIDGDPYAVGASYLIAPPSGTRSLQWAVTTTLSGAFGPMVMVVFVDGTGSDPIVDAQTVSGTTALISTAITSSGSDMILGGCFVDVSTIVAAGSTLVGPLYSTTQDLKGQIVTWPGGVSPVTLTSTPSASYPRFSVLSLQEGTLTPPVIVEVVGGKYRFID